MTAINHSIAVEDNLTTLEMPGHSFWDGRRVEIAQLLEGAAKSKGQKGSFNGLTFSGVWCQRRSVFNFEESYNRHKKAISRAKDQKTKSQDLAYGATFT